MPLLALASGGSRSGSGGGAITRKRPYSRNRVSESSGSGGATRVLVATARKPAVEAWAAVLPAGAAPAKHGGAAAVVMRDAVGRWWRGNETSPPVMYLPCELRSTPPFQCNPTCPDYKGPPRQPVISSAFGQPLIMDTTINPSEAEGEAVAARAGWRAASVAGACGVVLLVLFLARLCGHARHVARRRSQEGAAAQAPLQQVDRVLPRVRVLCCGCYQLDLEIDESWFGSDQS